MKKLIFAALALSCLSLQAQVSARFGSGINQKIRVGSVITAAPVTEPAADILWYKFNEGSGTTLTADVGPNGTTSAGTGYVTGADSVATHAFDFGGDCTSASGSSVTYGANVITVCFWANNEDWTLPGTATILSSKDDTTTANTWRIYIDGDDDVLLFQNQGTTVGQFNQVSLAVPSNSTWHHFAVVFDASTAPGTTTVYLNGAAQSVTQGDALKDGTSNFAANAIRLGNLGGSEFYGGSLDDVRIYGSALSAGQIGAVYANPE